MRNALEENHTKDSDLNRQVAELQVYERRNAEFKLEMAALEKQLDTLKTIVPEEKELDEFMRLLAGSGGGFGRADPQFDRRGSCAEGLSLRAAL